MLERKGLTKIVKILKNERIQIILHWTIILIGIWVQAFYILKTLTCSFGRLPEYILHQGFVGMWMSEGGVFSFSKKTFFFQKMIFVGGGSLMSAVSWLSDSVLEREELGRSGPSFSARIVFIFVDSFKKLFFEVLRFEQQASSSVPKKENYIKILGSNNIWLAFFWCMLADLVRFRVDALRTEFTFCSLSCSAIQWWRIITQKCRC